MKKLLFFIVLPLLFTPVITAGQDKNTDLPPQQLQDSLNKYYNKDIQKFLFFANRLKKYYQEKKDFQKLIILDNKISYQYTVTGKLPEAIGSIDEAIKLSGKIKNDSLKGLSYITKAAIYFHKKDYLTSIKLFSKADSLTTNDREKTSILRNYAFIKKDLGDYLGAIHIYKKIYNSHKNLKQYNDLNFVNTLDIINAYQDYIFKYQDHPEFHDSIQKYIKIAQNYQQSNPYLKNLLQLTIIRVELSQHPENGTKILKRMDSIQQNMWHLNIHYIDPAIFFYKAQYYYRINDYEKALAYLQKISASHKKSGFESMYIPRIYDLYAKVYRALGDTENALEKTMELNRMLQEKEQQRILVDKILRDQYDYQNINKHIKELEEKVHKESNINTYLFTGIFVFLIFFTTTIYRRKILKENYEKMITDLDKHIDKLENERKLPETLPVKKRSKSLPPDKIYREILKKLKEFEDNYVFLEQNIDLNYMVDYVGYNKSYVSGVINDHFNMNLKDFINRLRIKYAMEEMKNPDIILSYNIKGLAQKFGFKTSKTFGAAFKKFTGMHPSEFIKQAKKELFQ